METSLEPLPIGARRAAILAELAALANPPPVLVAVTKTQSPEAIDAILATGHRVYGENRVQEAEKRWAARRPLFPDLELRLIGPLQTNKAENAVKLFDVIETLDRPTLVSALARAVEKTGRRPACLIEVNLGGEAQKAGCAPQDLEALLKAARREGLIIQGLMCIPPAGEMATPYFEKLARLKEDHGLQYLSMGMSSDYVEAARAGATHVRLGTALFGQRLK
jgi:hypothetical protein